MSEQPAEVDVPLDPFADPAAGRMAPLTEPRTGPTHETKDQRERRCPFHTICVCDHTECFDGWLDTDEAAPTDMNPHHVSSRRCPRCDDAREMHTELQGMRGKR